MTYLMMIAKLDDLGRTMMTPKPSTPAQSSPLQAPDSWFKRITKISQLMHRRPKAFYRLLKNDLLLPPQWTINPPITAIATSLAEPPPILPDFTLATLPSPQRSNATTWTLELYNKLARTTKTKS